MGLFLYSYIAYFQPYTNCKRKALLNYDMGNKIVQGELRENI